MESNYSLYWIHFPDHQDIYSEGYVGISANLNERIKKHRNNKHKGRFVNGAVVSVIAKNLNQNEALLLEKKFRPKCYIGWNKSSGGFMPPIPKSHKRIVMK